MRFIITTKIIIIKLGNEHLILNKSKYLPSSDIENVCFLFEKVFVFNDLIDLFI